MARTLAHDKSSFIVSMQQEDSFVSSYGTYRSRRIDITIILEFLFFIVIQTAQTASSSF